MKIKNTDKSKLQSIIAVLLFSISLVPYVSSFIPIGIAKIGIYLIVYSLFGLFLYNATYLKKNKLEYQLFVFLLLIYISMLGIRLYVDFIIKGIEFFAFGTGYTIMFLYFVQIVIPAVLFSSYKIIVNVKAVSFYLVAVLTICMILSIRKIINGEVEMTRDGRFDNGYGIFSIEFGHYAVSLILVCTFLLKTKIKTNVRPFLVLCIIIGGIAAILAGSRGPIVALVVCLLIYFVSGIKNLSKLLGYSLIVILIAPIFLFWAAEITDFFSSMGVRSAERIYESFLGEDNIVNRTSGRDTLYSEALYYFSESPIFGYSYLIPGKIYCHNIILEQFMALGILGGTIFLGINIIGLREAWKILRYKREYAVVPLLYIQYFIFGCFSITIINLPQYWLFLLLTMNFVCSRSSINTARICNSNR